MHSAGLEFFYKCSQWNELYWRRQNHIGFLLLHEHIMLLTLHTMLEPIATPPVSSSISTKLFLLLLSPLLSELRSAASPWRSWGIVPDTRLSSICSRPETYSAEKHDVWKKNQKKRKALSKAALLLSICSCLPLPLLLHSQSLPPTLSHLSLLADNWHVIIKGDIIEQSLQENVCNTDQVVILLWLIEWIAFLRGSFIL